MDLKSIFGGVSIGRDTSGNVKPSIKGLAVKVADGTFVARDGDGFLDVGGFVFDGGEKYVYRLPVSEQQVEPGDLLIMSDSPFQALFVKAMKDGTIFGLDPTSGSVVEYVPHANMFGLKFFVKAVSLIENLGSGGAAELLPLLLLGDGGGGMTGSGDGDSGLTTLLLLQSLGGGQAADINKLLPLLLLLKDNKGDSLESLLLLQALGLNLGNLGAGSLGSPANKPGLPPGTKTAYSAGKTGRPESADKA
jgi:hypothetical protein